MIRPRFIGILTAAVLVGSAGSVATSTAAKPVQVVLAPPKVKPGNACAKGVSGCTHGKFTGNFFGD